MEVRMRRPIARAEKSCPPAVPPLKRAALGWLRGIVLVAMMAAAGRAAADDALARLHARGTLRWGGDMQGGEPYVFQDPRDRRRLAGFEVEIADALARRLDVRAEFAQNDWQTLIPSLERGDFDVALNGIEVTPARRARVAFTRPYYAFTETLVMRRGDGTAARGLEDLRGRRVGTLEGSLAYDPVRRAPRGGHGCGGTRAGVLVDRARAALPPRHRLHDRDLGARDGARGRRRPRAERRAAVRRPGAAGRGRDVRRALPRHARTAPALRALLRARPHPAAHGVQRGGRGARAQLCGVRGRALPRGPGGRAGRAERGGGSARHVALADAPADRAPPGASGGAPRHRQRLHRAPEGFLARVGDHRGGAHEADDDHRGRRAGLAGPRAALRGALPRPQLPALAARPAPRAQARPRAGMNDGAVVAVRGLESRLGGKSVLGGIDLEVRRGEVVA